MKVERNFTVLLIGIAAIFLILSLMLPLGKGNGMIGAGFFPTAISAILLGLLLVNFIQTTKSKNKEQQEEVQGEQEELTGIRKGQFIFLVSLVACLFLTDILGMLLSIGIFIVFTLYFIEKMSWRTSILFSTIFIVSVFFVFEKWFGLHIPKGFWSIII
ncbi:tripartite tricarboxylate transporter TctB family protein [Sporosarcina sp. FSL W7-1349]|uniref:tripartite tricarboxylate transporter TctB family protein n=1 Tax=Sporosarcina sp. FSL W7-1349 TaxID=2921561 RepID=UPI0030F4F41D